MSAHKKSHLAIVLPLMMASSTSHIYGIIRNFFFYLFAFLLCIERMCVCCWNIESMQKLLLVATLPFFVCLYRETATSPRTIRKKEKAIAHTSNVSAKVKKKQAHWT